MTEVVGIKYDMTGRLVYVLPDRSYRQDDLVIVETSKGKHLAQVVRSNKDMEEQRLPAVETMAKVLGPAQQKDVARYQDNLQLAEEHFGEVERLIAHHGLDMKLVDIVFPLERQRVLITFVAEKRVDFRQLLKDLASLFRARIELRQINNREEAKIYGGLGPCGRALCCSSFLGEFPPVSIKMAKNQNLSLNAGKTNGVCGRLMCCLSFEDAFYRESKAKFPDVGSRVMTQTGAGFITAIDVISETVKVRLEEGSVPLTFALEEVSLNG